jgi:hypothetical protein
VTNQNEAPLQRDGAATAQPPPANKSDILKARLALKASLKDPESVQFMGEYGKPGAVCGMFNAKNSFGGYVGATPYAYVIATGEVLALQDSGTRQETYAMLDKFERYCPPSK